MSETNLGRVSIVPKGAYEAVTEYKRLDLVTYNRNAYQAKVDVTGVTPGTDATKWMLLVEGAMNVEEAEQIISDLQDMITSAEESSTASTNHPVGDYFIYNDKLYRTTVAIASGGTITPNTNCVETTIGQELNQVNDNVQELGSLSNVICSASSEKYLTFNGGVEGVQFKSAQTHISLYQSGSGDPSSENERNISTLSWMKAVVSGKNLLGGQAMKDVFVKRYSSGYTWNESGRYISATAVNWSGKFICRSTDNVFKPNTRYTIIFTVKNTSAASDNFRISYADGTVSNFGSTGTTNKETIRVVTTSGKTVTGIYGRNSSGTTNLYVDESGIFEGSISLSQFEAFKGAAYISDMPENILAVDGTWDIVNGTFTTRYGYIDSYNNETLPGEWVSNKAVYAEGTTPPIGSQVAYKLGASVVYDIEPKTIKTVGDENNINCFGSGNDLTDVEYIMQTKAYIDQNINDNNTMIADIEQTTALESHAAGDLFICNNMLLKANAAIAAGEAINTGSGGNAEVTTIADEIMAIRALLS